MNYNKTTRRGEDNFYQTLDLNVKVLNDKKIWENKLTKENFDSDKDYVLNLNLWEENNFDSNNKNKKENENKDTDNFDGMNTFNQISLKNLFQKNTAKIKNDVLNDIVADKNRSRNNSYQISK